MAYKNTFSGLDYWKLADELSVIDASFLTLMSDPGHFKLESPEIPGDSRIFQVANWSDEQFDRMETDDGNLVIDPSQFRAVFKAIRNAILSNKMRAKINSRARVPDYQFFAGDHIQVPEDKDEETRNYGFALSRGVPTLFSNADSIHDVSMKSTDRVLYILKEPDWSNTTIEVDELKRWFKARGVAPSFFFPEGMPDGFRDRQHSRYSAKLATAIAAWEAITKPVKKKALRVHWRSGL